MSEAIVAFDPKTMEDRLREHVRAAIAGLIPDEVIDGYVRQEVEAFFTSKTEVKKIERYEYGRRELIIEYPSLLRRIVWDTIEKRIIDATKEHLDQEWSSYWSSTGPQQIRANIEKLIVDHMPEIISNLLGNAVQDVLNRMTIRAGA